MNLKETVELTLRESGQYVEELTWEQDWGIIQEITNWPPVGMSELKEGEKLYKVSDNWRKRSGYMKVDKDKVELEFHHIIIY